MLKYAIALAGLLPMIWLYLDIFEPQDWRMWALMASHPWAVLCLRRAIRLDTAMESSDD